MAEDRLRHAAVAGPAAGAMRFVQRRRRSSARRWSAVRSSVEAAGDHLQAVGVDLGQVEGIVDDRGPVATADLQRRALLALRSASGAGSRSQDLGQAGSPFSGVPNCIGSLADEATTASPPRTVCQVAREQRLGALAWFAPAPDANADHPGALDRGSGRAGRGQPASGPLPARTARSASTAHLHRRSWMRGSPSRCSTPSGQSVASVDT